MNWKTSRGSHGQPRIRNLSVDLRQRRFYNRGSGNTWQKFLLLQEAGVQVLDEYPLEVHFHGRVIGKFLADLIVERRVLVEVKACKTIEPYAEAQLLNYLKVAGGGVGLLLNFGPKPEFTRMVIGDLANSLPYLNA